MHIVLIMVWAYATTMAAATGGKLWKALNPQSGALLRPLLVPRPPGSSGSLAAQTHISKQLESIGWDVHPQKFVAKTPIGDVPMTNIVARRPGRPKGVPAKYTFAAHYDSLIKPPGFIGAIDSAFPCALLLWLAQQNPNSDFDLIFFDGEEAFVQWSDHDSIYGAKAMVEDPRNTLPRTLVLLDIMGHQGPPVPSWFSATDELHAKLTAINDRLIRLGKVKRQVVGGPSVHGIQMQDDHLPFLRRGVPVLHLIPARFPPEWHTLGDNADLLDWPTIETWALILQEFLA